ncbi:hypothetical protein ACFPM0_10170 [Pseudonocardia sulfidoxydans]|uniref:hypothetical protein n=1 Tax=Pseudonocardia sulfidoxydans TaxID=54011 RepID=UPI0036145689
MWARQTGDLRGSRPPRRIRFDFTRSVANLRASRCPIHPHAPHPPRPWTDAV